MPTVKQLKDIIRITSGGTPSKKKPEYWDGDIPWISAKSMKGDTISDSSIHITLEGLIHGSRIAPKGSILLLVRGSGLFNDVPICYVDRDVAFNQDVKCLESLYPETIPNKYIFYWLKSQKYRLFRSVGVTTIGAGKFDTDFILNLEIPIPALDVMKRQIGFMDALSSKLICNEKINQNLYEQIQTIYCKDFDPASNEVTGVLSDICKFSTDKVQISDLSVSTYYSTENMQPNKAGAVDASSLPSVSQTTRCRKGDVLVSNIRPYFKKIVYVTEECGCSTDVLCFVPQPDYSAFLFGTLYMDRFFDYMVAGSKGTKMPRGDKQQIMKYPIVVPTAEAIIDFNSVVIPMLEQITINNKENRRLATMRDTLLPKLMSGDLDVSDIEI